MPTGIYKRTKPSWNKGISWEEFYGKETAEILRKKKSDAWRGEKNPNFGKRGEECSWYGSKRTEAERKAMSLKRKGKIYKQIYGEERAEIIRQKFIGINNHMFGKRGEDSPNFGSKRSEETRKNLRIGAMKRIEKHFGVAHPNFNLKACELFKSHDERLNTKGEYAVYGGGEHFVKELGYWLDYFNPELKLIIEYDEPKHYDHKGNLKPKDVQRQAEIQALHPDFEFRRIKEGKIL